MAQPDSICTCPAPMKEDCADTWIDCADYVELSKNYDAFNHTGGALFKTFVEAKGDVTNRGYMEQLSAIVNSPTNASNQITYDMFQLAAARVKCDESSSGGGSALSVLSNAWWKENIYGTTAIGKAIYYLSLFTTFYLIIRILISLVLSGSGAGNHPGSPNKSGNLFRDQLAPNLGRSSIIAPLIIMTIVFLVITTIVVNYTVPQRGATEEEIVEQRATGVTVMGWISVISFAITLFTNFFASKGYAVADYFAEISNLVTCAILLFFNFAIGAYVPQFALVALLVQKYFFSTWGSDWLDHLIRGLVIAVLSIIGWYIWGSASNGANPAGGRYSPNHVLGGMYSFFIATTVIQSGMLFLKGSAPVVSTTPASTWTLLFFPLMQGLISMSSAKLTSDIFASNSSLFS